MDKPTILLVEDDYDIQNANMLALQMEGYHVLLAATLVECGQTMQSTPINLVVLDVLLPDGNALEYCKCLQEAHEVNILFLSALNTKADIVAGLRAGGDDYLVKPYLMDEFIERVKALLRRSRPARAADTTLHLGSLQLNILSRRAQVGGKDLLLSPKEFALLELLAKNRGRYVPAAELYRSIWNMETAGDLSTVHNHIYSLRKKLGKNCGVLVSRKRGSGYCIE